MSALIPFFLLLYFPQLLIEVSPLRICGGVVLGLFFEPPLRLFV